MEKAESVKIVFNKIAKPYIEYFGGDWEFIDEINDFISELKPKSYVLDLGCGDGYITEYLNKQCLKAIGMDFSEEMIKLGKEKYPNIEFINDDILNIEKHFKENSLDGAIAIYSLYFIPREQLNDFLESLSRIMKKGAKLLIITLIGNGEDYIRSALLDENKVKEDLYVNYYLKDDLEEILIANYFSIDYFKTKGKVDEKDISDEGRYIILLTNNK